MAKMRDMASNMEAVTMNDRQPWYPTFSVTPKQLPEAKNWKVGEVYEVKMKVKLTSMGEKSNTFEMQKIGCDK